MGRPPEGPGTASRRWANSARRMLVLRRQEELGGQIYLRIVRKHIFIAFFFLGVPEVARGVPGPNGGLPHFRTALDFFLKTKSCTKVGQAAIRARHARATSGTLRIRNRNMFADYS